jgi:hypothetical protein
MSYCKTCQNDYYRVLEKKDNLRWKQQEKHTVLKWRNATSKARLAALLTLKLKLHSIHAQVKVIDADRMVHTHVIGENYHVALGQ